MRVAPPSCINAFSCSSAQTRTLETEHQQPDALPAVSQRQHKQAGAAELAGLRVPDQRAGTVIDLRLFAGWSLDDDAGLGSVLLQSVNKAANALLATLKPVLIH